MPDALPASTLLILGPTAVGKSDLAVELAERFGGEIVGADAYQIYRGLDLLSAKPDIALRRRVPHHLIDELPLTTPLDVAQYRVMALNRIEDIANRGHVPIVCGGAGMYIRALTHGLSETPCGDPDLRQRLEAQPLTVLVAQLRRLDPQTTVDEQNPRRVVRALEVCLLTGRPFSSFRSEWEKTPALRGIILTRSRESLLARIERRTAAMFADGVVEEVANCGEIGPTAAQMLGLREIQAHLAGETSEMECIDKIQIATRQYAKRQATWFRRERGYSWLNLDECANPVAEIATKLGLTSE